MSSQPALAALSTPRKLLLAAGALLLIVSFLPWYRVSAFGVSASASGWHQIGTIVWIVLIATLIWEGVRVAGAAPVPEQRGNLITAALGGLVVVLGVIFLITRLSDGHLAIGFWLGLILLAVFAYATFQVFQAGGGQDAVREVQAEAQQRRAAQQTAAPTQPPPPANTPEAAPPAAPPATPPTQEQNRPQDPPATP